MPKLKFIQSPRGYWHWELFDFEGERLAKGLNPNRDLRIVVSEFRKLFRALAGGNDWANWTGDDILMESEAQEASHIIPVGNHKMS